jgi:predicted nucleotide-binding protein
MWLFDCTMPAIMTSPHRRLPRLFIGSSSESLILAHILEEQLRLDASIKLWTDRSIFKPAEFFVDSLLQVPHLFDFGLFLFEPDDVVESRGRTLHAPRDNVIFELGLFMSRLGLKRAFAIIPRGKVKILSDISGLKQLEYDDPPEADEMRREMASSSKPKLRALLEEDLKRKLQPALKPVIDDLKKLIESGPLEATGVFSDAPNVVQVPPTLKRLLQAAYGVSDSVFVRHLALDMGEAWGIIVNEILHGADRPSNLVWQCLMIDPNAEPIKEAESASVSVKMAAGRIHDMRRFLDEHAVELKRRNVIFECKLYGELPQMHGFYIEGAALLWSMCDIHHGRLDAFNTPYWRFEAADEGLSSYHPARAFKNWFDYRWLAATPAWGDLPDDLRYLTNRTPRRGWTCS